VFGTELGNYIRHTSKEVDLVALVTQHPERPKPLREYDQIYMLPGSELTQAKLVSDYLRDKEVVMIGDGDCMSLTLGILDKAKLIKAPSHIVVLDFDDRILRFIKTATKDLGLPTDLIETTRHNVRYPIPSKYVGRGDVFYTNPPYGSADKGECEKLFLERCMECCKPVGSWGVAILPFEHHTPWSREAMANVQPFLIQNGYVITEMIRGVHQYHLEDRRELYSGTVVVDRVKPVTPPWASRTFTQEELKHFYGHTPKIMPDYIDGEGNPVYAEGEEPAITKN
jgi:predicted methyltransferase